MSIIVTEATVVKYESLIIPFCGNHWLLLHSEIVRNSMGFVDFDLSKASLQITNKTDIDLFYLHNYDAMLLIDNDNFLSYFEINDGVDLNKDDSLWTDADWYTVRVKLTLRQWAKSFHFKNEKEDDRLTELGLRVFGGESLNVLPFVFGCNSLFPSLDPRIDLDIFKAGALTLSNKVFINNNKKNIKGLVYLIGCEKSKTLKIGFTKNLDQRLQTLQRSNPFELKVMGIKKGTTETEREVLCMFQQFKLKGEWFSWDDSIIAFFKSKE